MPIVAATLQGELIDIYEKGPKGNPSPQIVGLKTAKAYLNYVTPAMNAGAGSFSAMPGASALGQELGQIYSSISPAGALTGQKMAKAFNDCLSTFISVHQTTIVTATGLGGLIAGLIDIFSSPNPSATLFANKLAKELNTFTLSAQVIGGIPGTPPVPFAGPLS